MPVRDDEGFPEDVRTRHRRLWQAATRHRFLDGVRDASIGGEALDAWLGQDYRFVASLLTFQCRLLARAPREAQGVLAGGTVALVEELGWFEQIAAERRLDLDQAALPATEAYVNLLHRLDEAGFSTALMTLWVLERVYLEAWAYASPSTAAYRDFVEHWTAPAFADYVDRLALAVRASTDFAEVDDAMVADVLVHEAAFWEMVFTVEQR